MLLAVRFMMTSGCRRHPVFLAPRLMQGWQPCAVLELAEWSVRTVSSLCHLERHGLVELQRSPKALVTEFLIVMA